MDFDDDAPPDLVETGVEPADEEKIVKVPITIVTGTSVSVQVKDPSACTDRPRQDISVLERQRC